MAIVLTLVQAKQIRINVHKRNNTKNTVQIIQNTVNTSTHVTKTPRHYKTNIYTPTHTRDHHKESEIRKLGTGPLTCVELPKN